MTYRTDFGLQFGWSVGGVLPVRFSRFRSRDGRSGWVAVAEYCSGALFCLGLRVEGQGTGWGIGGLSGGGASWGSNERRNRHLPASSWMAFGPIQILKSFGKDFAWFSGSMDGGQCHTGRCFESSSRLPWTGFFVLLDHHRVASVPILNSVSASKKLTSHGTAGLVWVSLG